MAAVRHLGFLNDVNYAPRRGGSDQGHLPFQFGEAGSTASKVMTIHRNPKWPPSTILNRCVTSVMPTGAMAVTSGISRTNLVELDLLLQKL